MLMMGYRLFFLMMLTVFPRTKVLRPHLCDLPKAIP